MTAVEAILSQGSETIQPPHLVEALHASQPSKVVDFGGIGIC